MHPGSRIDQVFLYRQAIDFRKSITGLAILVEQELGHSPFGSARYVFVNRQRDKIKALYWHRNGFCLWYKRLEKERFAWPQITEPTVSLTLISHAFKPQTSRASHRRRHRQAQS